LGWMVGIDTRALHTMVRAATRMGLVTLWDDASGTGLWYEGFACRAETWLRARCSALVGAEPVQVIVNRKPTRDA